MYSPSSVAGYLPANPAVIKAQLLALLAAGEAVYPLPPASGRTAGGMGHPLPPAIKTGHPLPPAKTTTAKGAESEGAGAEEAHFVLWRKSLLRPAWSR
jgi:hypothetical protein